MGRLSDFYNIDGAYPASPGWKESTTSRDAARAIEPDAEKVREAAFKLIAEAPRTADEVAVALRLNILTVRPRCSELRATNRIRPSYKPNGRQERRASSTGHPSIVWERIP